MLITRTDAGSVAVEKPDKTASASTLFYRLPRPVVFRLYSLGNVDKEIRLVLHRISVENVIDEHSPTESLTLSTSKWAKKTLIASFTESGSLTQLSNERGSELAGAAETVKNLPADYVAALKQANDAAEQQRKLALQSIDARIERLNRQKSEKEAALALREVDDVGDLKQQIAKLENETKLLDAERGHQTSVDTGDARHALQAEQEMTKLENAIVAAKAERLELEAKLEQLRKEAAKSGSR